MKDRTRITKINRINKKNQNSIKVLMTKTKKLKDKNELYYYCILNQ